jgi:protein gp37
MGASKIEWTNATWNPVRGCWIKSPGCLNCYAARDAARFAGPGLPYEGLAYFGDGQAHWTGEVRTVPEKLVEPIGWREPKMIFVNSMSDLFHEDVPDRYISAVWAIMAMAPRHTFQVLTKRAERLPRWHKWLQGEYDGPCAQNAVLHDCLGEIAGRYMKESDDDLVEDLLDAKWPLPNVWIGVSVEDQKRADERIPLLQKTPAAVRFLSVEPMLGPINLTPFLGAYCACGWQQIEIHEVDRKRADAHSSGHRCRCGRMASLSHRGIDWVIVGGESGPLARPCELDWVRSIVEQCDAADVPVFVKQLGAVPHSVLHEGNTAIVLRDKKGGDPDEWPEDLRVRQFPRGVAS